MTQSPAITLRTIANGKYMEEFECWQSDQFAFRQFWVTLKTKISYIEGERESNGVYRGKNHCLLEEIKVPDEESLEENLEAINTFQMTYEDIPMYMSSAQCGKCVGREASGAGCDQRSGQTACFG
ncbi:MAG: hypothetical protein V8S08_08450 [Lachnoclostridium sp.]